MGAWIETTEEERSESPYEVAPFMGAWIETELEKFMENEKSRSLHGSVD